MIVRYIIRRYLSAAAVSLRVSDTAKPWSICAAVCVERFPVVTADPAPIEKDYAKMIEKIEEEQSLLSDHEARHREDVRLMEMRKQGIEVEGSDERILLQTAQDFADASLAERRLFATAPRDYGVDSDLKDLNRALSKKLVLVVKHKGPLMSAAQWTLPHAAWSSPDTLKKTAQKALGLVGLTSLKHIVRGNAPVGYWQHEYSLKHQDVKGFRGRKMFFYKAVLPPSFSLPIQLDKEVEDYCWLTHTELKTYLFSSYYKRLSECLFEL